MNITKRTREWIKRTEHEYDKQNTRVDRTNRTQLQRTEHESEWNEQYKNIMNRTRERTEL